jgi:gluconokinase
MTIIVMGVTGSGKTTIGTLLAQQLGWTFADADDFHTPANKEKMSKGIALTDADRGPWLEAIHEAIVRWEAAGTNAVVACSALKQAYRDLLSENVEVKFVYLRGSAELILERLGHRKGHYAKENLVASQFEALEEPQEGKNTHVVEIGGTPEQIVAEIRRQLKLQ